VENELTKEEQDVFEANAHEMFPGYFGGQRGLYVEHIMREQQEKEKREELKRQHRLNRQQQHV
jgi:hypothetical protein